MANIDKNGYIKTEDASGNIVTLYPYTKAGNVDGLDVFGASGSGHSSGLVPDPGATSGSSKFLCENGTWAEPSGGGGAVTGVKGNSESSYRTGNVNLTPANIGAATSDHTHGNITNDGKLQTTDVSIANGDKLVITDSSDSSKIARASVSFDGSTTTQFLSKKGTWETPSGGGVTGVKGSNESSYRTGNVSLSYSDVGAASSSHSHSDYVKQAYYTSNKTSGSLNDLSEGRVYCSSNCTNLPVSANMMVETLVDYNGSYKTQRAEVISGTYAGSVYTRYYNGSWSSWRRHDGVVSSPSYTKPTIHTNQTSKITIDYGGYVIVNGLVNIALRFTVSSAISSGNELFINLPPIATTASSAGTALCPVSLVSTTSGVDASTIRMMITYASSSASKIVLGGASASLAAGTYLINATYLRS